MPVIHGVNASPFVRKVLVALAEKGIAYEQKPVMPFNQSKEFYEISPLGKIPVYQDGEFTLPDSSCIIAYLERTQPKPALYPSDPQEFGRALWYEEYSDSKLTEAVGPVFFQRAVRKRFFKQEPDEELVQKQLKEVVPPIFDYLESQVREGQPLVGAHFSIADLAVGSIFANFKHGGEQVDAGRWPKLAEFVERTHSRPSFKARIEEETAAFAAM